MWESEPVQSMREWRCFILNHQVLDVRPYKGDYHIQYDSQIIDQAVAAWSEAPSACSLDIGVTSDNRTLVVEANDGFSLGTYGLNPYQAAFFHETRWREITEPYFADHQIVAVHE
ncbi:ATP-grasp domain-containing protein [Lacticaseibacillus chiayiensis]|uniref:ATP-grasp domain-containing protein n=1 Tax=Lacticaseibacillus chiayiensis TaxID=2100821 RepID=UPI0023521FCA|nr:ATP-grasp domain-containing protein [Lacticaseibacillus chiayiensis]